jgi:hypoxanthine-DNA glycosylase
MFNTSDLQEYTALDPIVYDNSEILILMSMPSVDSEMDRFYFADESNRFWPLMSAIYQMPAETKEQRLNLLKTNKIALWSVVKSCLRYLSRENTMQDIVLNDIQGFLQEHPTIQRIVCVSHDTLLLLKEADYEASQEAVYVPSPSAADLWYDSVEKLIPEYTRALGVE